MSATAREYVKGQPLADDVASAELEEKQFEPRFGQAHQVTSSTAAENFYLLLHHAESPAIYRPAFALVINALRSSEQLRNAPPLLRFFRYSPEALRQRIYALRRIVGPYPGATASDRSHLLRELAPTALFDGCWLQHIANAATAHHGPYARLSRLYAAKLGWGDPASRPRSLYEQLLRSCGIVLPGAGSWFFITQAQISEQAFTTPAFQLALSFFPRYFLAEIIGYTLGHFAGISALNRWGSLSLVPGEAAERWRSSLESAVEGQTPLEAVFRIAADYLASLPEPSRQRHWRRLWNGVRVQYVIEQPHRALLEERFASEDKPSLRQQVLAIVQAKRAFARGHHHGAELFGKSLAQWIEGDLDPFLSAFAQSPYVKAGDPDHSPFFHTLLSPDGPMYRVFSSEEIATLRQWVHRLKEGSPELPAPGSSQPLQVGTCFGADPQWPRGRKGNSRAFRKIPSVEFFASESPGCAIFGAPARRDEALHDHRLVAARPYGSGHFELIEVPSTQARSWKELFHRLVNVDVYPQIRAQALVFVHQWLRRTEKVLRHARAGDLLKPFPYSHPAFEARIAAIYADAVSRYRPFVPPPRLDKQEYQWLLEQVAPFTLVDGCWLQNVTLAGCANESVRAKLFQIYDDEIGNGDPAQNHANIFRELLRVRGMPIPLIDSPVDLDWSGVAADNFAIADYLLAISQFPKSFFPEILGLNLAIELSGLGGFYHTLIDELRYLDIDPRFFVLHQAVDNLASGHARLACDAIALYLDEVLASSGEEEMQHHWRRIWTGYGALTVVSKRTWRHIAWAYVRRFGLRRALGLWRRWHRAAAV